jgi:hypothetical protein
VRKSNLQLPMRSSNYLPQKEALGGRRLNDLKMYLRSGSRKQEFHS